MNKAEELFVRIQRLGVPKLDVSKLLTFKFVAITAVRISLGLGIVIDEAPNHIAKAPLVVIDSATS